MKGTYASPRDSIPQRAASAPPLSRLSAILFSLFEDRSGRLWIGTTGGLDYFNRERQSFAHFDPDDISDPITNKVTAIYERPAEPGVLWLGIPGGVKRFDCQNLATVNWIRICQTIADPRILILFVCGATR